MVKTMPDKIASAATYCTSGGLICGGAGGMFEWFHGLDWNVIALISGIVIGLATYFTNLYFKYRQTRAYENALARGNVLTPPQDD
ncbi:phage holin [Erwinia sp. V71]|uniref:phage holin n=1 Tax=Erwinia sp. V71 TaxID=3369424 RepID=UPI003F639E7E